MGKEFGLLFMDNGKGWKGWKRREEEKKQGKGNGNTRAAVGFHGPPLRDRRQHCWISRLHAGCTRLLACSIARCHVLRGNGTPLHFTALHDAAAFGMGIATVTVGWLLLRELAMIPLPVKVNSKN